MHPFLGNVRIVSLFHLSAIFTIFFFLRCQAPISTWREIASSIVSFSRPKMLGFRGAKVTAPKRKRRNKLLEFMHVLDTISPLPTPLPILPFRLSSSSSTFQFPVGDFPGQLKNVCWTVRRFPKVNRISIVIVPSLS